ncbi:hypothetical protein [Enterococcus phage vB_EfaM_Ef2.3]|uniref:Uncharacterized protein n=3 Tax=Kochikohdavirus TaxID=2560160 RepID=A0A4D6DUX0_9CAUD|nr:hypothetical protein [Enterococcus phage ECP3]QBZ69787.1 hypothetical protein [Enterococcus phage vB_EfaM_Ef2.1]QBZ70200.1 hypothetical protein [Enterococcus phage vB_EfaM_Ef2.3]QVW28005.1 hypothetical protein [Enterococcus phage MDA2]BBE37384.1 hypothetical protein PHIM1EF22_1110 [Enterococcus phage phiM1EF22]AII28577.1 hypothetical protein [Enterococcus phage ECP3]
MIWWQDNENYKVTRFRCAEDLKEFLNELDREDEVITIFNDGHYNFIIIKRGEHVE